jgi:hypothetical protein
MMQDEIKLEPPFYLPEIIAKLLPQARPDGEAFVLPEDALDSDELCASLNAALIESIEASRR